MNLPNFITLARLLSVPLTVWLMLEGRHLVAFAVFVTAGISDALDGFLARRLNARSVLGGYLDPLADKALLMSVYIVLGYQSHLPSWLVILVVSRDIMIVGGSLLLLVLTDDFAVDPLVVSKINTVTLEVVQRLDVPHHPIGITFDADSREVWVASYSGAITVFRETEPDTE